VRSGLEKTHIKLSDGRDIKITASFGIVVATKDATIEVLLEQADKALYRAKAGGRNRIEPASGTSISGNLSPIATAS
jgi:diguanylate cyclase (GGDEF)-like protein